MTCIIRWSFATRKGSRSPESREPYYIANHIVELLSLWFFSFRIFLYTFIMFVIDFSVIWLHLFSYFDVWTNSLKITHCIWCFHWDLWVHNRDFLIKYHTPSSKLSSMNDIAPSRKSVNQTTVDPPIRREKGKRWSRWANGPSAHPIKCPHLRCWGLLS